MKAAVPLSGALVGKLKLKVDGTAGLAGAGAAASAADGAAAGAAARGALGAAKDLVGPAATAPVTDKAFVVAVWTGKEGDKNDAFRRTLVT